MSETTIAILVLVVIMPFIGSYSITLGYNLANKKFPKPEKPKRKYTKRGTALAAAGFDKANEEPPTNSDSKNTQLV